MLTCTFMMATTKVLQAQLAQVDAMWVVRIAKGDGRMQEFRCSTEQQARSLMAMLSGESAEPAPTLKPN